MSQETSIEWTHPPGAKTVALDVASPTIGAASSGADNTGKPLTTFANGGRVMAADNVGARPRAVNRFQEDQVWASGKFTVDAQGRVWRGSRRAENATGTGYLQVKVMVSGTRYYTGAHRLVWRALRGPIPFGMVINHKNGRKDDNRPENLEVVTYSANTQHAHRTGLLDEHGERNPAAKLSNNEVAQIRSMYAQGGYTMERLGAMFGVRFQHISRLVRGTRRRKQGGPVAADDQRHSVCGRDPITGRFLSPAEWPQDINVRHYPEVTRG